MICSSCGYEYPIAGDELLPCPLCSGQWDVYELQFPALPLLKISEQVASWLSQLPHPSSLEMYATPGGLRLRLYTRGDVWGSLLAWSAMTDHQTRWKKIDNAGQEAPVEGTLYALRAPGLLPVLALTENDPLLALGGQVLSRQGALRIWLLGKDLELQQRVRAMVSYSYGTEGGVDSGTPNPWGLRLLLLRIVLLLGLLIGGISGGGLGAGWFPPLMSLLGVVSGGALTLVAGWGMLQWMQWRSMPKDVLERRASDTLLKVCFTLRAKEIQGFSLLAGESEWKVLSAPAWPAIKPYSMAMPVKELAGMVSPPEVGEISGLVDRDCIQTLPTPPASQPLLEAPFKVGRCCFDDAPIGIDPDAHAIFTGGSRTGKSTLAYQVLSRLLEQGADAPGIFLVDPHVSLADAFLQAADNLPPDLRAEAIRRLRIITPDQPEVLPLNLLAVPDFSWAGNAMVQVGRRIWDDYWGPRMQAALLGLFRLAHTWNREHPDYSMGLLHVVFAAYNPEWRHSAMAYMPPVDRMGTLALDALLGQAVSDGAGKWERGWATEVISPVLSKAMSLELSPWLFKAMHQARFVDFEQWIQDRCWIVMRLPAGSMGREGARLTAGVIYNIFDAAFRRTTERLNRPIPYYFVIDEAQEIGLGMRIESMLAEGAKFGAKAFILSQSLSMMRKAEGFEPVVQALLANTSTQAFFSPDPEDADLIRAALSMSVRYGETTLDQPNLNCWLRARLRGQWQPPIRAEIDWIRPVNKERVTALIREVIESHPQDYIASPEWEQIAVRAMTEMISPNMRGLLDELLAPSIVPGKYASNRAGDDPEPAPVEDLRNLGF